MFSMKNIWTKLDGSRKTAEPDMAELLALLKESQDARDEARDKLAWIADRREGLLLSDNDHQLDVDDREAEKWHRRLERAEYAIPQIQKRIAEIRDRNREALVAGWKARARENFERNRHAFEELVEAWRDDQAMRQEFEAAHVPEVRLHDQILQGFDLALAFEHWLQHSEMMLGLGHYAERAEPSPNDVVSSRSQTPTPRAAPVKLPPPPKPKVKAPPRAPIVEEEEDGKMLVAILRDGVELADGRRPQIGDVLAVEPTSARSLMKNGAVDLVAGSMESHR
jgi:hypothetical protein